MKVTIKLFATLREGRFKAEIREIPDEASAGMVLKELSIGDEEVAIILVNGRDAGSEYILKPGDTIAIFPPVGGG